MENWACPSERPRIVHVTRGSLGPSDEQAERIDTHRTTSDAARMYNLQGKGFFPFWRRDRSGWDIGLGVSHFAARIRQCVCLPYGCRSCGRRAPRDTSEVSLPTVPRCLVWT